MRCTGDVFSLFRGLVSTGGVADRRNFKCSLLKLWEERRLRSDADAVANVVKCNIEREYSSTAKKSESVCRRREKKNP